LPDGIFFIPKFEFGYILEDFGMETVGIFYGDLVYFWLMGLILESFGIVAVIWYNLAPFWYVVARKIWHPCSDASFLGPSPI
jgi:hypothetical protein